MEIETQFLREKQQISPAFETFVRYKINLEIGSLMRSIYMYLALSKACPEKCLL